MNTPTVTPTVRDTHRLLCKWCGQPIAFSEIERPKSSSDDEARTITKHDYHPECWDEAIEVVP